MRKKTLTLFIVLCLLLQSMTVFAESTSGEGNVSSQISSSKASTWSVSVPDMTLDSATGVGTGLLNVTADLGNDKKLVVTPSSTIVMKQTGKPDITADVAMSKTSWKLEDVITGPVNQTITVTSRTPLTAGTYTGSVTYTVSLESIVLPTREEVFAGKMISIWSDSSLLGYDFKVPQPITQKYGMDYYVGDSNVYGTMQSGYSTARSVMELLRNPAAGYTNNNILVYMPGLETSIAYTRSNIKADFTTSSSSYGMGNAYLEFISKVKSIQNTLSIHAPVVYVNRYIPEAAIAPTCGRQAILDLWADPKVEATKTGNIVFVEASDFLTDADFTSGDNYMRMTEEGVLKLNNAIEDALYQWYIEDAESQALEAQRLADEIALRSSVFADKDIYVINDSFINGNFVGYPAYPGTAALLSTKYGSTLETTYATPVQTRLTRTTRPMPATPDKVLHIDGPALIADNATYDSNDIVILSGGYENRFMLDQNFDFREWNGQYVVGIGTEYVYAMNKVKAAQAAKGVDAPIVFIKQDFTYVASAAMEAQHQAVYNDQRIKEVNTGNVIFIDVAKLGLTAEDYAEAGCIYAPSGHAKVEQAVEDALYEYYTK